MIYFDEIFSIAYFCILSLNSLMSDVFCKDSVNVKEISEDNPISASSFDRISLLICELLSHKILNKSSALIISGW